MTKVKMVVEMTRLIVVEVDTEMDFELLEEMAESGEEEIDFYDDNFSDWDVVSEERPVYVLTAVYEK